MQVPSTDWYLSCDSKEMVALHEKVQTWVETQLTDDVGAGTFQVNHDDKNETFYLLPQQQGKFFIVNMHLCQCCDAGQQALQLLFTFHNLYFVGFEHGNRWYLFSDASVDGSGYKKEENREYWRDLGFSGGYSGNKFTELGVGYGYVSATFVVLTRYERHRVSKQISIVKNACFRVIVVLPESWRFRVWRESLHNIFRFLASSEVVDAPGNEYIFEKLFRLWGKISVRVLAGPYGFQNLPLLPAFHLYSLLVRVISMLLRRQFELKPEPED